ncbi:unnamed protein product [Staurois parvus]|uniref:Uncharacterized protein n=1 Tax=Staurois parvus TaxID=386267 RepID=A0ABN9E1K9_9NEOB|nr:unnamed protein product [Staurois parvus]
MSDCYYFQHNCIHYIAKSIGLTLQIIGFRCSNYLHGHRHADCFYKTFLKEWVALRSSVNSSVVP